MSHQSRTSLLESLHLRNPNWRQLIAAALFATLSTLSAGAQAQTVTMMIASGTYFLPFNVAEDKGFFTEEGLTVQQRVFPSGTDAVFAFRAVNAEFIASGDAPSLNLWQGGDVVGVAPVYASSDNLIGVVRADLRSAGDLKGKKIAVKKGSTADYFLMTYLKKNNVDPSEVHIVDLSPPECVPALSSGDIAGFFLWQPFPELAMHVMGDKVHELTTARGYYLEQIYLSANRKFAEANPETIAKVLRALRKAMNFIQMEPEQAAEIGARHLKADPAVVAATIKTKPFTLAYKAANRDQLEEVARYMWTNHQLKSQVDVDRAFDPRYLKSIGIAAIGSK